MKNFFVEKTSSILEVGDTMVNQNLIKTLSISFFLIFKNVFMSLKNVEIYLFKKEDIYIYILTT